MNFLCSRHLHQLSQTPKLAQQGWTHLVKRATCAHQKGNYQQASQLFGAAGQLAQYLAGKISVNDPSHSIIDMLLVATHNFCACLCRLKHHSDAEHAMQRLHRYLCELCLDSSQQRELRIDALSNLDRSLFSLTTLQGQLGQVDQLHSTIAETEKIATRAEKQLFQ